VGGLGECCNDGVLSSAQWWAWCLLIDDDALGSSHQAPTPPTVQLLTYSALAPADHCLPPTPPPPPPYPAAASKAILALEGVVDHGLFLDMVDVCIIAGTTGVEVGAPGCTRLPVCLPACLPACRLLFLPVL
jgi:hypothetical protein